MNKQELIEKFEERKTIIGNYQGYAVWWEDVKEIFEQLDEPKPVKVPPLVSVWYRINKDNLDKNIACLCSNWEKSKNDDALFKWMSNTDNFIQILVNMHQFGYEVDEEKRYLVKIKASGQYIMNNPDENAVFFYSSRAYSKLTRKQLEEAGFGWVFDCPGIEIEEVDLCH